MKFQALALCGLMAALLASTARADIVVNFETAQVGQLVTQWVEQDVVFTPATPGLLSFHMHSPGHMGIFNAIADENIPVQAMLPVSASSVSVVFWGSFANTAILRAYNSSGLLVNQASMQTPQEFGQFAILFELTVSAPNIAFVRFQGTQLNGFMTADELRFTPIPAPGAVIPLLMAALSWPCRRRFEK